MGRLRIIASAAALVLGASLAWADCNPPSYSASAPEKVLAAYTGRTFKDPETMVIAGLGDEDYLLDRSSEPITSVELAEVIQGDARFANAKRILLAWPYSAVTGRYLANLQTLLKKPVIGFNGPMWWYPDGTAIGTAFQLNDFHLPNAGNALQCLYADGKYYDGAQCQRIAGAVRNPEQAVFGNAVFIIACGDVKDVAMQAGQQDADTAMRLYFYYAHVLGERKNAMSYLLIAARKNLPQADYLTAVMLHETAAGNRAMYMGMLKLAADGGNEKAKALLDKINNKQGE